MNLEVGAGTPPGGPLPLVCESEMLMKWGPQTGPLVGGSSSEGLSGNGGSFCQMPMEGRGGTQQWRTVRKILEGVPIFKPIFEN